MTRTTNTFALACLSIALIIHACSARPAVDRAQDTLAGTTSTPTFPPDTDTAGQLAEYVVTAFADSKGVLWFGTIGKGVARYDGMELTFLSPAGGKGGNVVSSIAEDKDGNLWFAGHHGTGVCSFDGHSFTQIWEDESGVTTDASGNVWAGTRRGVHRYDGRTMEPFALPIDKEAISAYAITSGSASFALEDSKGNYWFRTDGSGALKYDGKAFTQFSKADGLCSNTVNDIVEDERGNIWFICMQAYQPKMTDDGGLCVYDGKSFRSFPDVKGLHHNDLYTLFKDSKGNLWIGATGIGMYKYDGSAFTLYNTTDRPDLNGSFGLQGMTEDHNSIFWCGFSGGLFRFDPRLPPVGATFVNVMRDGPW